jgi:hypothetical protein
MQIMALPLGADRDLELAAGILGIATGPLELDALPPAQAVAIFHQQQPLPGRGATRVTLALSPA